MERFTFTTGAVDSAHALEFWADQVLPRLEAQLVSADERNFSCTMVGRRTRGIACASVEVSSYAGIWRENARLIGSADSLRIYRVKSGLLTLKVDNGAEYQVGPGDAFVSGPEAMTHYSVTPVAAGGTAMIADMTTIPLSRLEEYGRFFERNLARPLPRTPSGNIVNTFVDMLRSQETPDVEYMALMNSFTELVAVTMGSCGGSLYAQARDDVYYRALACIRTQHKEAGLTVEGIARKLGVSERALFAAFDGRDLTPHKYINRVRIDAARTLLTKGCAKPNIMDVALCCGFDSVSTFNRQFRAQTGVSPSEYCGRQSRG